VLKKSVSRQHRVVGFNHGRRNLGRGRHGEGQLGLASVVNGKPLKEKRSETRSSTSTSSVEDEETLKTGTVVGQLTDPVKDEVNDFLQTTY
jgi:hypothetical protein